MTEQSYSYSLYHFFEEAKVTPIPEFFKEIGIWHAEKGWIKPRWHQITGLNGAFQFARYGIFDKMGTGKTLIAHAWSAWHAAMGNRPVWLMPPILLDQFTDNYFLTFPGIDKYTDMIVYHGMPAQREQIAQRLVAHTGDRFPVLVTTPEMFRKEFPLFSRLDCCAFGWDEADCANPDTKANTAVRIFMGKYGDRVGLVMNGTPASNDLRDLYGFINFLTPDSYRSRIHYNTKHVEFIQIPVRVKGGDKDERRMVQQVDHFKNFELLYENLYRQARRIEKEEVLELEPCTVIPVPVKLTGEHYKLYDEFCTAQVMLFEDGSAISGEQSSTMRQIAMQGIMNPELFQCKEESAVLEMLDQLVHSIGPREEKIFIAAYYHKTVEKLIERYKEYGAVAIYGGQSPSKNLQAKGEFINNDKCRIAVVNYESGGVGLDGLQNVCCYGIAAEPITVPGHFEQYRDRLHRGGQTKPVTIYALNVPGTIWNKATAAMLRKDAWNKAVVSRRQLMAELKGETNAVETTAKD